MQQRSEGEIAGLADALLQIPKLAQLLPHLSILLHRKSVLAHHQHSLDAQRELGLHAEIAEHVGEHCAVEMLAQRLQILSRSRFREFSGVHHLEQFRVEVEARPNPLAQKFLALSEHDYQQRRQDEDDDERRHRRRKNEMVEQRVKNERDQQSKRSFPRFAHNPENRRRAAVHDRRSESAHDPQRGRRIRERREKIKILRKRETGADCKSANRRIDEKSDAPRANHPQNRDRFQELLDRRRSVACQRSSRHPDPQQPVIDQKAYGGDDDAGDNQLEKRTQTDEFVAVEVEKAEKKKRNG